MAEVGNYPLIYYKHGVSSINFIRICLLITRICTDLFRIVLGSYISPAMLRKKLDDNKYKLKKKLNEKQIELIYPDTASSELTPNDLDLSALFKILRFVFNIQKHKNGWGIPPKMNDNSIAACLDRIRLKRDHYFHKPDIIIIDDTEFQNTWDDLRYSVVELEKRFIGGDLFKTAVDDLYTLKIAEELEKIKQPEKKSLGTDGQLETMECDTKADDILGPFFNHGGSNVRFATFLNEIAESVPRQKLDKMKEWIKTVDNNCNSMDINDAVSPRECLEFLKSKNYINPSNLVCLQFVLEKIECRDLFRKCFEYAKEKKALCFHGIPEATRNGSTLVHVHVRANLTDINQSDIEKITQTFVDIMHCSEEDVQVGGICPSASFFLVLSIKTAYQVKLLNMEQQDKYNLGKLNIDYFIVDFNVVFLGPLKDLESKWKMYYGLKTERRYPDEDMHWKEHIADHTLPLHTSGSDCSPRKRKETSKGERVVDENPKTEFGAVNKESITDVLASDETVASQQDVLPSAKIEEIRKSVGLIFIRGQKKGLGFRVGDKYILTCAHVVQHVLSGSPNTIRPDQINIEFKGMKNSNKVDCSTVFGFQPSIAYFDEELDFSILELAPLEVGSFFPPPFTYFREVCATGIHLVVPSDDQHTKVDSSVMPRWLPEHKYDIEGLFKPNTAGFTDKLSLKFQKKIFFQTTFSDGCSGSPGIKMLDGKPYIVLMFLGQINFSDTNKVQYGIAMSDIKSKIISSESQCENSLASTIFPEWDTDNIHERTL